LILAKEEAENLGLLLPSIHAVATRLGIPFQTIVILAGSDSSEQVCRLNGAQALRQEQPGYGNALRQGFANCTGDYILTIDADLSHPVDYIQHFIRHAIEADLVIGSRYMPGGCACMPWLRKVSSRLLNRVFQRILRLPVHDISSGFRLYRRKALQGLKLESRDFNVLVELAIRMLNAGYVIKEIPFQYQPRRQGSSKARLLRFMLSYLKTLWRMYTLLNQTAEKTCLQRK